MKKDDRYRLAKVGIFVLVALVLFVSVIGVLGRSRSLFSSKALLHAQFTNISGLVVGAPVRLAGVDIGIVDAIDFDPDPKSKQVHVELGVQSRYLDRIRADSIARLSSKGLLGDMLINITVGSPESAQLRSGGHLKAQESQGLSEVVSSVQEGISEVRQLVGRVDARVQVVLSDAVARDLARLTHSTANLLEGVETGHGLLHEIIYKESLARSVDGLTGEAQQLVTQLHQAVGRADHILLAVEKGQGVLHGLVYSSDGDQLIHELTQASRDLAEVVAQVRRGSGPLHSLVYADANNLVLDLSAAARILRSLAEETAQGRGSLGGLLKDPSVYEDLKLIMGKVRRNTLLKALIRYAISSEGLERSVVPK